MHKIFVDPWREVEARIDPPVTDFSLPDGPRPSPGYWACKAIDGYPDLEWSFQIYGARTRAYYHPASHWQFGYESLPSFRGAVALLGFNGFLRGKEAPDDWYLDLRAGLRWFDSGYRADGGVLPLPGADDPFRGRHSVALLSVTDDPEMLIFSNTWGTRWGDGGLGYLTPSVFNQCVDDLQMTRSCCVGPSPAMDQSLTDQGKEPDFARAWGEPNPFWAAPVEIGGRACLAVLYAWRSLVGPRILCQSVDLRSADGHRIAWVHVAHDEERGLSTITDLFVWPSERRGRLGTWLEDHAALLSRAAGSTRMRLLVDEADWQPRLRAAALAFGSAAGYVTSGDGHRSFVVRTRARWA